MKLAYNEDSEKYYVSIELCINGIISVNMSVCHYHNFLYLISLGNESCFKEEADEAVRILA